MSNGAPSAPSEGKVANDSVSPPSTGWLAFWLVVIMLSTLFVLVLVLLAVVGSHSGDSNILEYGKWALSTLLGAFGAWIGAGAAYFFGKENLAESSRSTAEALRIQQETLRSAPKVDRIKDISLTAMNKEFMFNPNTAKKTITAGLEKYVDYWWVPVLDQEGKGILEDVVHARVFWDPQFNVDDKVANIIQRVDSIQSLSALHGPSFFLKVTQDERIVDVMRNLNKSSATVGVVVDDKGKPTYCFTKENLVSAQR